MVQTCIWDSSGRMHKVIPGCFWDKERMEQAAFAHCSTAAVLGAIGCGCALPQGLHSVLCPFSIIILCGSECHPPASAIGALGSGICFGTSSGGALVAENKGKKVHWLGRRFSEWGLSSGPAWTGKFPLHTVLKRLSTPLTVAVHAWESICWQLSIYLNTLDFWRWMMALQWNVLSTGSAIASFCDWKSLPVLPWTLGHLCCCLPCNQHSSTLWTLAKNWCGWTCFQLEISFQHISSWSSSPSSSQNTGVLVGVTAMGNGTPVVYHVL